MNNKTMHKLSYGLFVLTAKDGEKDNGCIVNTAIQLTSDPQMISVAVNKNNLTCEMIKNTRKLTVSILSEKADFSLFKRFGFQSGRDVNKFEGFSSMKRGANGLYYITEGTNGFISAYVQEIVDVGTHLLFIAQVTDMDVLDDTPSVTYSYYLSNIKPKPEKVGTAPDGQTIWRCVICGYEYVGEELPEDFICPICKHPASDFEKVK